MSHSRKKNTIVEAICRFMLYSLVFLLMSCTSGPQETPQLLSSDVWSSSENTSGVDISLKEVSRIFDSKAKSTVVTYRLYGSQLPLNKKYSLKYVESTEAHQRL